MHHTLSLPHRRGEVADHTGAPTRRHSRDEKFDPLPPGGRAEGLLDAFCGETKSTGLADRELSGSQKPSVNRSPSRWFTDLRAVTHAVGA
jgi:hypothetical protein